MFQSLSPVYLYGTGAQLRQHIAYVEVGEDPEMRLSAGISGGDDTWRGHDDRNNDNRDAAVGPC